jgi:hypothetical protein
MSASLASLSSLVILAADTIPDDEDVVAGAWGAATFVVLILALAVLGFSLNRHLRKAQNAKDAGAFGDEPIAPSESDQTTS